MNERQIVSLAIRIIGLLGMFYVVRHWFFIYHKTGHIHFDNWWKLIAEICLMFIGLYMVSGARLLVRFMTKDSENKSDKPDNKP